MTTTIRRTLSLLLLTFTLFSSSLAEESKNNDIIASGDMVVTKNLLIYQITEPGDGRTALPGDKVKVHYTGWLVDGTQFDSSKSRDSPFVFSLGAGRVIKGWDQGVAGMKVGETRELIIPSELAYGKKGAGKVIPPNAHLLFEVTLLDIVD